jgi:hypothetical protein
LIIRHYTPEDDKAVTEIFREANLPDEHMKHREYESFTIEDAGEVIGIITMTEYHGYPAMKHACIRKDKRSFKLARMVFNFGKYYTLSRGYIKGLVGARTDDNGLTKKVIERLTKCKGPYAKTEQTDWYLVEVCNEKMA